MLAEPAVAETRRPTRSVGRRVLARPAGLVGFLLVSFVGTIALFAGRIASGDPFALANPALQPPSAAHLLGTDNLGRDLFSAVVHGLRTSLAVVVGVTIISAVIGLGVGAVAGYRGAVVERALMRLTELFQTVPRFFLALLVLELFGRTQRNLVLLLGLTSWTLLARTTRVEASSLRTREYVGAARSYGASHLRIVARHMLPNLAPTALVVVALNASRVILLEAGLSFLGLGDPSKMSLGFLIQNAQPFLEQAWWMSVFPGLAIVLAVLGINLLADALNDVLDPLRPDEPATG